MPATDCRSSKIKKGFARIGLAVLLLTLSFGCCGEEITDASITKAVRYHLALSDKTSFQKIDVETRVGIVHLSGEVEHLLARKQALEVALSLKGVRSVIDRIVVRPAPRPDREIQKDVKEALFYDPATESFEIDVQVTDGAVSLHGQVQSNSEKELCEAAAKGVRGVRSVSSEIEVIVRKSRPDAEILHEIEQRLRNSAFLSAHDIDVAVSNGNVTLSGAVNSADEKYRATHLARVANVRKVDATDLGIELMATKEPQREVKYEEVDEARLTKAVKDALLYDPRVAPFDIDVETDQRTVILKGTVSNLAAKHAAESDARHTQGVWHVKNRLDVRSDAPPEDAKLAARIQSAILRSPLLTPKEFSVEVREGEVTLKGIVSSAFEKMYGETIASLAIGVTNVRNNLFVHEKWTESRDLELLSTIQQAFVWDAIIPETQINVNVENGRATLRGIVETWNEFERAGQKARLAGAEEVYNKLRIRAGNNYYQPMAEGKL